MIRRSSRILLEILAALLAALVLVSGLVVWRLGSDEPLRLAFLTPYLEDALTPSDGAFQVRISNTLLTWAGWERTFDLRARGVRAVDADGKVIATVPEIAVSLSVRALLNGLVAPTAIDVFRPRLYLTRQADGRFQFGRPNPEEPAAADVGASSVLPRLLNEILASPDPGRATGYLRVASIIDGELIYTDRRLGLSRRAPDADIVIRRTPQGLAGQLSLTMEQGGSPARLWADVSYRRSADRVSLSARFADVAATGLADLDPDLEALTGADLLVGGRIATTIGLDGAIGASELALTAGPGSVALPALGETPLSIRQFALTARLDAGGDRLTVSEAVLQLDGPRLTLSGSVTGLESRGTPKRGRVRLAGHLTAADVPADRLDRYWPAGVARGARNWVIRNIEDGIVEHAEADVALRFPGGDPDAAVVEHLSGTFSTVGLTVHYLKPMPPLRDVAGIASFTDREFVADLHGGGVEGLSIDSGRLRIADFKAQGDEVIEIVGQVKGSLPDTLQLLDHPRLGYPSKIGLAPADTEGQVSARLSFRFPAVKDLPFDAVEIGVAAEVAEGELRQAMFGHDVRQANVSVEVTSREMTVDGTAAIGGVPSELRWVENFESDAFQSQIALTGTLDADQRAAFGLDFHRYLMGPVATELQITRFGGGRTLMAARLNLAAATFDLPFLAWSKPQGEPGAAELTLELEGERAVAISELSVSAGTLSAQGRGRFDEANGELRSLALDRLVFGGSALEDVAVIFTDRRTDVTIGGGRLDAEPLLADDEDGDEADEEEDTAFTVTAGRLREVRLGPDRVVNDVAVGLEHDGAFWNRILIQGMLPGGHPMSFRYEPGDPGTHRLAVTAEDAGAALRAFDVIGNVQGGKLVIVAQSDDADPRRPLRGKAEISEFRLVDMPALARLLTVATLTGLVDVLTGEGFLFNRFTGEFTKTGGMLEVPLARAYGPSIGLTAKGHLDFDADTVDLEGTIVPAYAINNILGNIPVIGNILQGGKGEGIFAATYRATGPMAEPQITVNPLAALAPGFLRGLFDIFEGGSGEPVAPTALPEAGSNK